MRIVFTYGLVCTILASTQPAWTASQECSFTPQNPLEVVYCKIEASKLKSRLVSIHEFRKNPPKTQRLLLRPLAKKIKLSLPQEQVKHPIAPPKARQLENSSGSPLLLPKCIIQQQDIHCENGTYSLQHNIPRSKLSLGALNNNNRLQLPTPNYPDETQPQYLSRAYAIYIKKMLSIGLAGATLSYTKFVNIYHDQQERSVEFEKRFEEMFELLKTERKSIAVGGKKATAFPKSLRNCFTLSQEIIICDNVKKNWIYTSPYM